MSQDPPKWGPSSSSSSSAASNIVNIADREPYINAATMMDQDNDINDAELRMEASISDAADNENMEDDGNSDDEMEESFVPYRVSQFSAKSKRFDHESNHDDDDEEDDDHLFHNSGNFAAKIDDLRLNNIIIENCNGDNNDNNNNNRDEAASQRSVPSSSKKSRSQQSSLRSSSSTSSSSSSQIQSQSQSQPQLPPRSWTIKLQGSRTYISPLISSSSPSSSSSSAATAASSSSQSSAANISAKQQQQQLQKPLHQSTSQSPPQYSLSPAPPPPLPPKQPKFQPNAVDLSAFPNSLNAEENFHFISVEHADTSFPVFFELLQSGQVCDVTIVVCERRFPAHRVVLCATIPYFYAMFTNDMSEKNASEVMLHGSSAAPQSAASSNHCGDINAAPSTATTTATTAGTPTLEPDAFESLLRYAYTGTITINSRNVQSILIGASFLGLLNVQQACADYLKIRLNVSNVLNVKSFAFALGCDTLVTASKRFIHRHFEAISRTDDFLNLDFDEVIAIIDRDELNIRGEEIVFEAVIAWTKKNVTMRLPHLPALLAHVRLPLLSPEYLTDAVMVERLVRSSLECRDLVDEAKDYHLLPARRELMQCFRTRPRFGHHVQGLIYAVGGLTKSGDSMSTVEVYDPQMKRWRMAEAMTMLRSRVGVAVMDGKLYAIGGYNGKERLNTVEVYDAKLKRWNKIATMEQRRSAVGAAPLNGMLYVCGGYDGNSSLNTVERYSPKHNRWQTMAPMNFHRSAAGVVAFDNHIYALGGHNGLVIYESVERYDTRHNRWELIEPMLTRRCRLGVTAFGGRIYVCGGYDGTNFLDSVESYDPATGKWSQVTPMRVTRSRVALVANCGRLFAIGGYDGVTNLSSVEMYDIERDCWDFTASMVAHEGGVGVGVIPD